MSHVLNNGWICIGFYCEICEGKLFKAKILLPFRHFPTINGYHTNNNGACYVNKLLEILFKIIKRGNKKLKDHRRIFCNCKDSNLQTFNFKFMSIFLHESHSTNPSHELLIYATKSHCDLDDDLWWKTICN